MMNDAGNRLDFRRRLVSFKYAFAGMRHVFESQPNVWIHTVISVVVFIMALWLQLSGIEWAILLLTVMVVWVAEFLNTALEAVVDMAMPEYHELAKTAKDVAAAAVLVGAIFAVIIGLVVIGPPLWGRLFG